MVNFPHVTQFLTQLFRPPQRAKEVVFLPLPCPLHACALIPEPDGLNGSYHFYCPLCRLACQPKVQQIGPIQPQDEAHKKQTTGVVLHTYLAKKRTVERLKSTRLVLNTSDLNSKPGETDALTFANEETKARVPKVRKVDLPDVG